MVVAAAIAVVTMLTSAGVSRGDLASRYSAGQNRAGELRSAIKADNTKIRGFEGSISSLQTRLTIVQQSLNVQQQQLDEVTVALSTAQRRLVQLQRQLVSDRRILAAQLIADYESPTPNLVDVIVEAHGWNDLVNKATNLSTIAKSNARTMRAVITTRVAVTAEARRLARIKIRREQTTTAVRVERDNIAQLKLSIVDRELRFARDRSAKRRQLTTLQKKLAHEATVLDREAAASGGGAGLPVVPPPGAVYQHTVCSPRRLDGLLPRAGDQLLGERGAGHRRPAGCARPGARAAPDRHLGVPLPCALGGGRRIRRRSPHTR